MYLKAIESVFSDFAPVVFFQIGGDELHFGPVLEHGAKIQAGGWVPSGKRLHNGKIHHF